MTLHYSDPTPCCLCLIHLRATTHCLAPGPGDRGESIHLIPSSVFHDPTLNGSVSRGARPHSLVSIAGRLSTISLRGRTAESTAVNSPPSPNLIRWLPVPGSVPPSCPSRLLSLQLAGGDTGRCPATDFEDPLVHSETCFRNSPELDRPGSALFGPSPSLGACAASTRGCSWRNPHSGCSGSQPSWPLDSAPL